ncbi:MAG: SDR family NAD(P)-dependent oxidoreductase [Wenzhouxiangella sp.]|jgi:NAD(P)-dependent dehydrogenase (short-subunit alcohol dehydrogenase family)|nr:SDR family NAD(P)-dependent oxidoreductase [Wenzhouxiangella sp.]
MPNHHKAALAVVIGASGGIGAALVERLRADSRHDVVLGFSRSSDPALDLTDEASIEAAAESARSRGELRLVIDATGFLHDERFTPEKSWRQLDPDHLARAFALNATGPALLMKHFLPLLSRSKRSVFATLSARVGSIGDNRLGGWHSYRASKAALNMLVRGLSIELRRRNPHGLCVALHPGTVDTGLSQPFSKQGLNVRSPDTAAGELLAVIEGLDEDDNGRFFDYRGEPVAW